jgi:phage shock protein PspC (stress-responsive transcriptional regulator)
LANKLIKIIGLEKKMSMLRKLIEKSMFGVCSYWGEWLGVQSSRVRLYFIYITFVAMGSPAIVYLFMAFWLNLKKYLRESKNLIWN